MNWRGTLFGQHGRKVVVGLCSYEVVALHPRVPLPPLSEIVAENGWRGKLFGAVMLGALFHHWYIEQTIHQVLEDVREHVVHGIT